MERRQRSAPHYGNLAGQRADGLDATATEDIAVRMIREGLKARAACEAAGQSYDRYRKAVSKRLAVMEADGTASCVCLSNIIFVKKNTSDLAGYNVIHAIWLCSPR